MKFEPAGSVNFSSQRHVSSTSNLTSRGVVYCNSLLLIVVFRYLDGSSNTSCWYGWGSYLCLFVDIERTTATASWDSKRQRSLVASRKRQRTLRSKRELGGNTDLCDWWSSTGLVNIERNHFVHRSYTLLVRYRPNRQMARRIEVRMQILNRNTDSYWLNSCLVMATKARRMSLFSRSMLRKCPKGRMLASYRSRATGLILIVKTIPIAIMSSSIKVSSMSSIWAPIRWVSIGSMTPQEELVW